ncbi:MAG: YeeE/YedE family protein [Chloroflexi bacterium]|nr:YeeE/YedE family protein [Chloroflexota bacterium]
MTTFKKSLFNRTPKAYVHPYFGGMVLGIILFLALLITGNGLGSSGATSRIVTAATDLVAPEHVDTTPYLLKLAGGDKNPFDDWIVPVFFGALLGGFSSGMIFGRVKLETTKGPNISDRTRWLISFLGGVLFLYGARLARGCTSGQALTGGATLSAGSWVVMFAIFGGAYAMAYFVRKFWN